MFSIVKLDSHSRQTSAFCLPCFHLSLDGVHLDRIWIALPTHRFQLSSLEWRRIHKCYKCIQFIYVHFNRSDDSNGYLVWGWLWCWQCQNLLRAQLITIRTKNTVYIHWWLWIECVHTFFSVISARRYFKNHRKLNVAEYLTNKIQSFLDNFINVFFQIFFGCQKQLDTKSPLWILQFWNHYNICASMILYACIYCSTWPY